VAARPDGVEREADRLPVIVVLDNVRSAFNVGLVFRVCDCVNVQALWLSGITPYPGVSVHATNHISRTAVGGSLESVPWRHVERVVPDLARRRAAGWRVVVYEQTADAGDWRGVPRRQPTLAVFGHEREGVRPEILATADEVAALPVRGATNSLNVAVCAGVVLYRALDAWRPFAGSAC
jgi:tRNA G18 (ribose-2'-O)-methylase SpoU